MVCAFEYVPVLVRDGEELALERILDAEEPGGGGDECLERGVFREGEQQRGSMFEAHASELGGCAVGPFAAPRGAMLEAPDEPAGELVAHRGEGHEACVGRGELGFVAFMVHLTERQVGRVEVEADRARLGAGPGGDRIDA